jgi:hypothetical protein
MVDVNTGETVWEAETDNLVAYDTATGEGVAMPGAPTFFFTPGRIVTDTGEYDTAVLNTWPVDVWRGAGPRRLQSPAGHRMRGKRIEPSWDPQLSVIMDAERRAVMEETP